MCGIWCRISSSPCACRKKLTEDLDLTCSSNSSACSCVSADKFFHDQNDFISRRGPDFSSSRCLKISDDTNTATTYLHLLSHVLWTQGEKVQSQPYRNSDNNKFMLFNGDIYSFTGFSGDQRLEEETLSKLGIGNQFSENDGLELFKLLEGCKNEEEICGILKNLQGPFAFIYIEISRGLVWFARDFFGRESLLFSYEENKLGQEANTWDISSVSVLKNVIEIPTSGLFCLEMKSKELKLFTYSHIRESVSALQKDFFSTLKKSGIINTALIGESEIQLHFSTILKFPGANRETSLIEKDVLLTALVNEAKLTNFAEEFIHRSVTHLSYHIDELLVHLRKSVKRRVRTLPPFCKNCMSDLHSSESLRTCTHSKVGVLFSGGLDSTVLAFLAAEALPEGSSLDLINVGFSRDSNFANIPDRLTALASYKMLNERFKPQGKLINLVLVNVGKEEVEEQRRNRIKYLISPFKSVLDDSIGVCLWFAARGVGRLYVDISDSSAINANYSSPVRIILLGTGADECFGGYSRHRSAYEKSGWEGLRSEMQLDFDRISIRNMGRDNRIVSDHGICPRIPFLDEHVVDWLTAHCDLWVKCCPVNVGPLGSRGTGEKLLLRAVGAKLFGDQYLSLALFPKRAMQFGSKIAKLENSKEKGGDSCQRLL